MSSESKTIELPARSYSIPNMSQKFDSSMNGAAVNMHNKMPSEYFRHSVRPDGSVHSVAHSSNSRISRVSRRYKTSSLQKQATQIEEALFLQQLAEENDDLIGMQLKEQERIAQRESKEKILQLQREDKERQARLHHELELQRKHNMIKRRDLEMTLFRTRAELLEAIEEEGSADLEEPEFVPPIDRNDTIPAAQFEHNHMSPRNCERPYSSNPPTNVLPI